VLAAIRVLNRLELVAETLRAALNTLTTVAPDWLQALAPLEWYERYGKRIEKTRLPREQAKRDAYAHTVGEDGCRLLDALDAPEAPEGLRELPSIRTYRREAAPRPNKRVDISLLQFCPGSSRGKSPAKSPLATPKPGKSAGSHRCGKCTLTQKYPATPLITRL
jgi:hypothetical protein